MQHQKYDNKLYHDDQRDPDHEFRLARLMTDQQHRQQHRGRTAERCKQQQRSFLDAPVAADCGGLVMHGDDDRDQIDDDQINVQKFQNNLGVIKCSIKE